MGEIRMKRETIEAENAAIAVRRSLAERHKRLDESIFPWFKGLAKILSYLDDALVRPMIAEKYVAAFTDLVSDF